MTHRNSIEIVIVLYQCSLEESATFCTLKEHLKRIPFEYELVIFNNDNSREIEHNDFVVVNSKENQKLPGAYNFAQERAVEGGKEWILLLDQDTEIPEDYFVKLEEFFAGDYPDNLAAVVPVLELRGKVMSPKIITSKMRFERDLKQLGYTAERINAFNSMSLFRVDFIKSIGGFSLDFPLDYHDHWCYNQLFKHQKLVYVLDVKAEHDSSFEKLGENVTVDRYKEFLKVEHRFFRNELGSKKYSFYKFKLVLRSFNQFAHYKNKRYSVATIESIFKK